MVVLFNVSSRGHQSPTDPEVAFFSPTTLHWHEIKHLTSVKRGYAVYSFNKVWNRTQYLVVKMSVCISCAVVSDSEIPWTVAHQAPLSIGLSRQAQWSGLPFSSPGDLSDPGIEPRSPAFQTIAFWAIVYPKLKHNSFIFWQHKVSCLPSQGKWRQREEGYLIGMTAQTGLRVVFSIAFTKNHTIPQITDTNERFQHFHCSLNKTFPSASLGCCNQTP